MSMIGDEVGATAAAGVEEWKMTQSGWREDVWHCGWRRGGIKSER